MPTLIRQRCHPATVRGITSYLESFSPEQPTDLTTRDKKMMSTYFKITTPGSKVIRIEIYNADQFENAEKSMCRCNAEVCVQHVVKNAATDNIYPRVKDIIKCIDNTLYTSM